MTRLRAALTALGNFARGFLGLTAPAPVDPATARRQLVESAERRPHCC